ncbi:retrovirus-related pol polyprotein from transposon TNT 1-94 [Tanacetum coccineum]
MGRLVPRPDRVMVYFEVDLQKEKLVANLEAQPDGFMDKDKPNHVYKLKKALYGLKQAPRAWYDMLSSFLISHDFSKGSVDPTLFIRREGNELLLVQIYVDDIIFSASTPELCDLFAKIMCSKFKMSMMGKISFFLGLQISQSPRGIFINQSKYALESLKKYGFDSCDPVDTPMVEKSKLDEDKEGKAIDLSHYRGMIGTLLYLIASRPDLQFAICMCARYQARPTKKHLNAVKRIFRYLKGTVNQGLWYPKDSSIALTAFADADHCGCQKQTPPYAHLVVWVQLMCGGNIMLGTRVGTECISMASLMGCGRDGPDRDRGRSSGIAASSCRSGCEDAYEVVLIVEETRRRSLEVDLADVAYILSYLEECRFYTSAGNPVKEILLKLNLPDHRKLKDGGEVKEFQRSFRHSDTERLSRSDEVLKLKNFKKDATLKLFKSTNQERHRYAVSFLMDTAYWIVKTIIFKFSLFKLQNACLFANLHQERLKKTKRSKISQKPTRNGEDKKKSEDGKPNQSKPDQPDTSQ